MKLYGGIQKGDITIGITHFPDRKRPVLYYQKGSVLYPLAYFTKDEFADMFWEQFQRLVFGQTEQLTEQLTEQPQTDCPWK